jgi:hypothetical protein
MLLRLALLVLGCLTFAVLAAEDYYKVRWGYKAHLSRSHLFCDLGKVKPSY